MNEMNKLNKIRAKCVELLAIAEKRTPGEWKRPSIYATHVVASASKNHGGQVCDFPDSSPECNQHGPDANFIASCAGAAEAGWRSTIAAIDALDSAHMASTDGDDFAWDGLEAILQAWEGLV